MNKTKIMTDSACDIPKDIEKELGIRILPFSIAVNDTSYLERIDFTNQEFYDLLYSVSKIPTTAQITQIQFLDEYKTVFDAGFTDLIYVSINSKGSNTYNSALLAKEAFFTEYPQAKGEFQIHVVDSLVYTIAYGYPVIEAAKKAAKGTPAREIVAYLEDWFASVEVYFAPYTLEFVKKSGRVSCAAAFVGELIGLRPIISFVDGETKVEAKVRGDKAIIPELLKYAKEKMVPHTPYLIVHGSEPKYADEIIAEAKKELDGDCVMNVPIGAAISINSGPKVVGIIFKGKKRR